MIINQTATGSKIKLKLTVSVDTGALVTATDGTSTLTGTAVSGAYTFTLPKAGTWMVSATLNGITSNTQTVAVIGEYSTSLKFASTILNDNDWSVISDVSDAGIGANYWSIGDCKAVALSGTVGSLTFSGTYYAFIIGFNHNSSYEGPNRIHFQFAKTAQTGGTDVCFTDSIYGSTGGGFRMNTTNSNSGGWASSNMRTALCGTSVTSYSGTFIAALPSELRSALKSVTKYTDNTAGGGGSTSSYVTATTDYIFLLSEYEVFGSISHANTNEASKQTQYAYYSAGNSKIKYMHSATTTAVYWWLRSPYASYSGSFVRVHTDGTVGGTSAEYSRGFAPGFCV